MRADRHRRQGRHVKQYQGWGVPDEADQLASSYLPDDDDRTPPMGFPAVRVPPPSPPSWPLHLRILVAGFAAFAFVVLGAVLILTAAFIAGAPEPAQATDQRPAVTITVEDGRAQLNDGTYTIEEARP